MAQLNPHVRWVDLRKDGLKEEVIVMKDDKFSGNLYYIARNDLDGIDSERMWKIITRRDAARYPLWELMAQETLGNGQNALEFFNQLVKVRTPRGQILSVNSGKIGNALASFTDRPSDDYDDTTETTAVTEDKRGPGRPKRD